MNTISPSKTLLDKSRECSWNEGEERKKRKKEQERKSESRFRDPKDRVLRDTDLCCVTKKTSTRRREGGVRETRYFLTWI